MMKVNFYAVKSTISPTSSDNYENPHPSGQWRWLISLDMNVDIQYWAKHSQHLAIYPLKQKISLGQALWLQKELPSTTLHDDMPLTAAMETTLTTTWLHQIQNKIKQLKLTDDYSDTLLLSKINLHNDGALYPLNPAVLINLKEQLRGRALLQEELMDLLEYMGLSDIHWRGYLQQLYLQGDIDLMNGVTCISKPSLPLLQRKKGYQCQRCGGENDKMFWTYCASCQCECPYCEACLNMGRTRFCSLLIHGLGDHPAPEFMQNAPPLSDRAAQQSFTTLLREAAEAYRTMPTANQTARPRVPIPTSTPNPTPSPTPTPVPTSARSTTAAPPSSPSHLQKWQLSPAQQEAAATGLSFLDSTYEQNKVMTQRPNFSAKRMKLPATLHIKPNTSPPCFLIWAVTGAGKTEMTFPLIESELSRKGRVALTTPRRDVVLELQPRLQKAFPDHAVVTLYGGSEHRWERGDITLTTTHQMLRFAKAFDLIIIDEVDAFPFRFNKMLEYAVQKSCTRVGRYILLSATPPLHLQKAIKRKQIQHAKVAVRFHRYPLPVPRQIRIKFKQSSNQPSTNQPSSRQQNPSQAVSPQSPRVPRALYRELVESLERGSQVFLFVPKIKLIRPLLIQLRNALRQFSIDGTSSQDPERTAKVQAFRNGDIRVLITTTILERGVTVPKTDVLVLHADADIFDESALVQMAGRSGRAQVDPYGKVCFFAEHKTRAQVKAIKQIKTMNQIAYRKGYLIIAKGGTAHVPEKTKLATAKSKLYD